MFILLNDSIQSNRSFLVTLRPVPRPKLFEKFCELSITEIFTVEMRSRDSNFRSYNTKLILFTWLWIELDLDLSELVHKE